MRSPFSLRVWTDVKGDFMAMEYPETVTGAEVRAAGHYYVNSGAAQAVYVIQDGRPVEIILSDEFRTHIAEVTGLTVEQIQSFIS